MTKKAYLSGIIFSYCPYEARDLSAGNPIIEGSFFNTYGNWTGAFVANNGDTYRIENGFLVND